MSSAIQHLEEELGITIVQSGQRFHGFTPDGERLLKWARILAQNWESMKQEATHRRRDGNSPARYASAPFPQRCP